MFTVATACLFLAAKIEENPRKLKDVVSVFDYVRKKKRGDKEPQVLDLGSFLFTDLKSEIVDAERFILKELGFSTDKIQTGGVHKYIYFYLRVLDGNKALAQKAWNYVNDSYRTVCVVCFPPNVIACACVYLASRVLDYPLPNDLEWWRVFGVKAEDMEYAAASILEVYGWGRVTGQDAERMGRGEEEQGDKKLSKWGLGRGIIEQKGESEEKEEVVVAGDTEMEGEEEDKEKKKEVV